MKTSTHRLRPGDLVEIKAPTEILQTLDQQGTVGRLPFMPEMVEFCGKRFRVAKRVLKTCYYGRSSGIRAFEDDDVVILENVRCSGASHDGCQKACTIFWREQWLRPVTDGKPEVSPRYAPSDKRELLSRLKAKVDTKIYFCQASEILNATRELSHWERAAKCIDEVHSGNCGIVEMAQRISIWLFWKVWKALFGSYGRGNKKTTPAGSLNLSKGELVKVKPMPSISDTLNENSYNRGLYFTPAMRLLCGQERRVEDKVERIIVDGTGEMRQLRDTVFLENSLCGCAHVAFGGCPRAEYGYWREIWVQRSNLAIPTESKL